MNKKSSYKSKKESILTISLITVSIVVVVVLVSYFIKLSTGVAKSVQAPEYDVRLEILNASSEKNLDDKVKKYLDTIGITNVSLTVVENSDFDIKESDKTFIINRTKDKKASEMFGEFLGINSSDIHESEIQQNKKQITATLVLGNDSLYYKHLLLKKETE
ncbi:MAG: LytR family transcriptional regulator [Calditrichaeota bacterium]|nr:MAG: LytR family transcriptional regulator [Calditrichota bacterium]